MNDKQLQPIGMSEGTFRLYVEMIYNLTGIRYADNKKYLLESKIAKRLRINNVATYEEYFTLINKPQSREELTLLLDQITINETFFFRSVDHFESLEKRILPSIISKKIAEGKNSIKIWSAASSTGEEAYSIAMILLENFKNRYPQINFHIFASDLSTAVIKTAKRGLYNNYSVRNMPNNYFEKYFSKSNNEYQIKEEVRKMVTFQNLNLNDTWRMNLQQGYDIIFCCNVLIYFDTQSKIKVIKSLHNSLNKGGYLFLGNTETMLNVENPFKIIHSSKGVMYMKE
ncbi:MAG: protein-glutamate O-methyltransferase CheR [Candidatus Kapaibacterium sp.]